MTFFQKTIFIISSAKWGKMHISKHHYALELASLQNKVFFINPPCKNQKKTFNIEKINETLSSVTYKPFFPFRLRFHFRFLYDILIKFQINKICKQLNIKPDILWCFETNLFSDLSAFRAGLNIYHPVDMVFGTYQKKIIKSTDYIFSVSNEIIHKVQNILPNKKSFLINHGLSSVFTNQTTGETVPGSSGIKACYFGNVLLSSLDRGILKKVINENPDVEFTFFGAYEIKNANIGGDRSEKADEFVLFLKSKENVVLKGPVAPSVFASEGKNYDLFIVLLDIQKDINKASNSHKILEYLSFGNVIVSNNISSYEGKNNLITMVKEKHNEKYPALFKSVVENINMYNTPELKEKRIQYALNNSYKKQIDRIQNIIRENADA